MPAEIKHNLITFRLTAWTTEWIYLTGGSITRRGGLEPDVWTFTIPYTELAKITGLADVEVEIEGVVELWYTNAPGAGSADVTVGNVAIVDLTPDLIGREPGDTEDKILTYQATISDHRRAFVEPRGGRLFDGLLNRDPLPSGDTLLTNEELMDKCAAAMGVTMTVGGDVDDAEPMREVDWQGAHAPTELQALLEHTGHVYAPLISGHAQVMKPGVGSVPTVPSGRTINLLTSPSIDRRPAEVIFISAPQAKVHTFNESAGAAAPAWQYVIQDPADDQWKPLADVSALTAAGGAAAVWTSQFAALTEADKARVREQLYCCIQLDPDVYPPGKVSLLPKWLNTDLEDRIPQIMAHDLLLVQDSEGSYGEHNDEVPLQARQVVPEANVLIFPHPLMKFAASDTDVAVPQLTGTHTPFAEADLKPTFSVKAWEDDQRDYATYGFSVSGVSLTTLSESAAKGKLTGYRPSVAVLESPDLVQVIVNPGSGSPTTNRDDMEDRAETYARNVVRLDTAAMQVLTIKGFLAVELDGVVSEVSYDPQRVITTVTLNGWNVTSKCSGDAIDTGGGGGGGGGISRNVTRQATRSRTSSRRRSERKLNKMGVGGSGKIVEPSRPKVRASSWPRVVMVSGAAPITSNAGRFTGKVFAAKVNTSVGSGSLALADIGEEHGDVEIWHSDSAGAGANLLRAEDRLLAFLSPSHSSRGKPIAVTFPNQLPSGLFPVQLEVASGANGDMTNAPTWTYNLKNLGGTQIATGKSPLAGREVGYFSSATYGIAYFDSAAADIKLLIAIETRSATSCPEGE